MLVGLNGPALRKQPGPDTEVMLHASPRLRQGEH
jgi:hypothetical protein